MKLPTTESQLSVRSINLDVSKLLVGRWCSLSRSPHRELAAITLTDGSTDHHLFWVNDQGEWVEAENLQPGDLLLTPDGVIPVDHLDLWNTDGTLVWELTIATDHTFTVHTGTLSPAAARLVQPTSSNDLAAAGELGSNRSPKGTADFTYIAVKTAAGFITRSSSLMAGCTTPLAPAGVWR